MEYMNHKTSETPSAEPSFSTGGFADEAPDDATEAVARINTDLEADADYIVRMEAADAQVFEEIAQAHERDRQSAARLAQRMNAPIPVVAVRKAKLDHVNAMENVIEELRLA